MNIVIIMQVSVQIGLNLNWPTWTELGNRKLNISAMNDPIFTKLQRFCFLPNFKEKIIFLSITTTTAALKNQWAST